MKQLMIAAVAALCMVSAHAKGFGGAHFGAHLPKMGVPHAEHAAKHGHKEGHLKAASGEKADGMMGALKSIDNIADEYTDAGEPMIAAKYVAH
jgi:hypothetical protein